MSQEELKKRLSPLAFEVTQNGGTERAFTGELWNNHQAGEYHCVVGNAPLFESDHKYESGSGWPSFDRPARDAKVEERPDNTHGMRRVEVRCKECSAHLGHLFDDGPSTTGHRYCINSCAMTFEPKK